MFTSFVQHECWPWSYCKPKGGFWELATHGKVMKEWYAFTRKCPERGIGYTPVALLLPFSHGQANWGSFSHGYTPWETVWGFLPYERADYMIDGFMYTIVPFHPNLNKELGRLCNSPYGDIYDVLLPNPPSGTIPLRTLNNYKVACLLGNLNIDKPLAKRLMEYVKEGGTLLLNVKQVNKHFPVSFLGAKPSSKVYSVEGKVKSLINNEKITLSDNYEYKYEQIEINGAKPILVDSKNNVLACVNRYGKGNLILTTVDYLIPKTTNIGFVCREEENPFISFLLRQFTEEALPLEVKGDIEYGLNKLKDGWLIYLINNKGIYKLPRKPQRLNPEETAKVEIVLKDIKSKEITELREDKKLSLNKERNSFFIEVGPGDIKVVKIKL